MVAGRLVRSHFWANAVCIQAALVLLLAASQLPAILPSNAAAAAASVLHTLSRRGLNEEDRARTTAGYYEGLMNEGATMTGNRITALLAARADNWHEFEVLTRVNRRRRDFLYYDFKPNLEVPYPGGRLLTNDFGMADQPYTLNKPAQVRRLALVGDSIARGFGVPTGYGFEPLLEDRLNRTAHDNGRRTFEILNFAVEGYRITQMLDVALDRASAFDPDVYLLALTDLSISRTWGDHLAQLVHDGIDLKYEFLTALARHAQLDTADDRTTFTAKLAPYCSPAVRAVLLALQSHAQQHAAALVVLLVPTADDTQLVAARFADTVHLLQDLDIPFVDLLDSFAGTTDLAALRLGPGNFHPNRAGHRLLFENLHRKLMASARLRAAVLGPDEATQSAGIASARP
ncbi:MAG: SGNH/GDSL hydrolase family protein [Deltaproteobacteria bacterium]|nr:SGNH/GDSL hydrolase family protein [Deltaproteobacteria bacterium]